MKETIKINLGLRLFDFDKDAYEKLKKYLDTLKSYFQKSPNEADEILQDIEQRMADLFEEVKSDKKPIITIDDVEAVIHKMGTVEDFGFENESTANSTFSENIPGNNTTDYNQRENRRLYRDLDNNILGGVCSGIAAYFNVDMVWVRLAFVLFLLFNGIGLVAYIILWIVVPVAKTTAEKLQMKGQPVTVENIEQSVKNEYNKVKENVKSYGRSDSFRRVQSTSGEIFASLGMVIGVIFKVIFAIIGISLAIAGVFLILGLLAIIPISSIPFSNHLDPLFHQVPLFAFALALLILVPIIGIISGLVRSVFNIRRGNNFIGAFFWIIWSLALVFVITAVISGNKIFSYENTLEDKAILNIPIKKALIVKFDDELLTSNRASHYNIFGKEVIYSHEGDRCFIKPRFVLSNSPDSLFYLVTNKSSSFGFANDEEHYYDHDYSWHASNNVLILDEYFNIDDEYIWTIPNMEVIVMVPKGKKVVLQGKTNELFEMEKIENDTIPDKEISF